MFVSHTIGVIVQDLEERDLVVRSLKEQGHEVVSAVSCDTDRLERDGWSTVDLLITDEANAPACLDINPPEDHDRRAHARPMLIIIPEDADVSAWLARGFDEVARRPLVPSILQARTRTLLRLHEATDQRFQSLFEHTPIGIFRLSAEGHLMVANPAFVRMLGYETFEDLRAAADAHIRIPIPPRHPSVTEAVWVRRDGRPLPILQRTHPVFSSSGTLRFFEGMIEDLSQRKMIEEELKEHAARLTLALDAAGMGDFVYDIQKDDFECAFLVYRLLGYHEEPEERGSVAILRRVHPDDLPTLRRSLRGAMTEDSTWQHEFRVVWPDDTVHWLVARGELFRDDAGRPERLIGVVRDATAEKKLRLDLIAAKQEAEKMAELKSTFLANMSHEIRTPLTAIIGFASLLSGRVPEEHLSSVRRIQQGGQRLLDTLNAVLTLARLESGQMSLNLETVDVIAEARAALRMFTHQAREKDLRLAFSSSVPEAGAFAVVDRGALASILQNLIGNAVKFTESGEVRVAVKVVRADNDRFVQVSVHDTGRGIDDTFLPHIFDEFRQESSGIRRQHEGAGLGLAISRRLTDILGGTIRVTSKKEEGSVFAVAFPLAEVPHPGAGEAHIAGPRERRGRGRLCMLVVEDNEDTRELLFDLLSDRFDVTLAGTAQDALASSRQQHFDIVLMDINLGEGQSGEEVAAILRKRPEYRTIPIIALTAYALPGDAERFLDRGFTAHLAKPFNPSALIGLLDRFYV